MEMAAQRLSLGTSFQPKLKENIQTVATSQVQIAGLMQEMMRQRARIPARNNGQEKKSDGSSQYNHFQLEENNKHQQDWGIWKVSTLSVYPDGLPTS